MIEKRESGNSLNNRSYEARIAKGARCEILARDEAVGAYRNEKDNNKTVRVGNIYRSPSVSFISIPVFILDPRLDAFRHFYDRSARRYASKTIAQSESLFQGESDFQSMNPGLDFFVYKRSSLLRGDGDRPRWSAIDHLVIPVLIVDKRLREI